MRTNRLGWIAALTLAGVVAFGNIALAADGDRPNREGRDRGQRGPNTEARVKRLTEALGLTEKQQKQVTAIYEEQGKEMQKLRDLPREERREAFGKMREKYDGKINAVLNDEQKKKYAEVQRQFRDRRGGGGQGGDRPNRDRPERPRRPQNDK